MSMPDANVFFENLPSKPQIEERGATNRYFVLLQPDGGEAVVCWSPNSHPKAQATLERLARERLCRTLQTTNPPHPRSAAAKGRARKT